MSGDSEIMNAIKAVRQKRYSTRTLGSTVFRRSRYIGLPGDSFYGPDSNASIFDGDWKSVLGGEPFVVVEKKKHERELRKRNYETYISVKSLSDLSGKGFIDDIDKSLYPSYTNFKLIYEVHCRHRYHACKRKYEKQLQRELDHYVLQQRKAVESARLYRF